MEQAWILNSMQMRIGAGGHNLGLLLPAGRTQNPGTLRPWLGGRLGLAPVTCRVSSACTEPPSLFSVTLYRPPSFLPVLGRHNRVKSSPRATWAPWRLLLPTSTPSFLQTAWTGRWLLKGIFTVTGFPALTTSGFLSFSATSGAMTGRSRNITGPESPRQPGHCAPGEWGKKDLEKEV